MDWNRVEAESDESMVTVSGKFLMGRPLNN